MAENLSKTTYPRENVYKNNNRNKHDKHATNVKEVNVSDPEDNKDKSDEEQRRHHHRQWRCKYTHIDEDHYIHNSNHDEFCKESLLLVLIRVEESFWKKGVEIYLQNQCEDTNILNCTYIGKKKIYNSP